jgi:hypothetical protein
MPKAKPTVEAFECACTLTFTRSTKGTHVFSDDSDGAPIPTLYIRKTAFPTDTPPKVIVVTIDEAR